MTTAVDFIFVLSNIPTRLDDFKGGRLRETENKKCQISCLKSGRGR